MPLGTYTSGTGTITTSTSSNAVTGSGTTFLTQLKPGAVIGNATSVYVGYVSTVISNTSATLTTNANLNISGTSFNYRPISANIPSYNYPTVGNITANIYSQVVKGNNTHFTTDLNYGDMLYISNLQIANASGPNVAVGRVELIISNTSLYLSSNAFANVSNLQYWNVPVDYGTVNFYGGYGSQPSTPNTIAGLYTINTAMFNWVQSGLIPNVAIVNNYHPPIRDSVTGILVNLPASIYKKTSNSYNNTYQIGSSLSYNGTDYVVQDFDMHQKIFGTDASYVRDSLHNGDILKDAVLNSDPQTYNASISQIIPKTSADRAANLIGASVTRITDNQTLAQQYFNTETPLSSIKSFPKNLDNNQDFELRRQSKGIRKLSATGAPIAIPGLLNVVADVYIPDNTNWTAPQFAQSPVNLANTNVS